MLNFGPWCIKSDDEITWFNGFKQITTNIYTAESSNYTHTHTHTHLVKLETLFDEHIREHYQLSTTIFASNFTFNLHEIKKFEKNLSSCHKNVKIY